MQWYAWVILILLVASYVQYSYPEKAKPYVGAVWDKVNEFKNKQMPSIIQCPTEYIPVCSGNLTYTNLCMAQKAGITQYSPGAC